MNLPGVGGDTGGQLGRRIEQAGRKPVEHGGSLG
jgi:hypothetical protein